MSVVASACNALVLTSTILFNSEALTSNTSFWKGGSRIWFWSLSSKVVSDAVAKCRTSLISNLPNATARYCFAFPFFMLILCVSIWVMTTNKIFLCALRKIHSSSGSAKTTTELFCIVQLSYWDTLLVQFITCSRTTFRAEKSGGWFPLLPSKAISGDQ